MSLLSSKAPVKTVQIILEESVFYQPWIKPLPRGQFIQRQFFGRILSFNVENPNLDMSYRASLDFRHPADETYWRGFYARFFLLPEEREGQDLEQLAAKLQLPVDPRDQHLGMETRDRKNLRFSSWKNLVKYLMEPPHDQERYFRYVALGAFHLIPGMHNDKIPESDVLLVGPFLGNVFNYRTKTWIISLILNRLGSITGLLSNASIKLKLDKYLYNDILIYFLSKYSTIYVEQELSRFFPSHIYIPRSLYPGRDPRTLIDPKDPQLGKKDYLTHISLKVLLGSISEKFMDIEKILRKDTWGVLKFIELNDLEAFKKNYLVIFGPQDIETYIHIIIHDRPEMLEYLFQQYFTNSDYALGDLNAYNVKPKFLGKFASPKTIVLLDNANLLTNDMLQAIEKEALVNDNRRLASEISRLLSLKVDRVAKFQTNPLYWC